MKPVIFLFSLSVGMLPSSFAMSSAGFDLANKSGCMVCHHLEKRIVGPAYQEVANKYRNDNRAESKLTDKIKRGSSGVWGQVPMPANSPKVSDGDILILVKWVLAGAK